MKKSFTRILASLVLLAGIVAGTSPAVAETAQADLLEYRKFFTAIGGKAQYDQMLTILISQFQQGFNSGMVEGIKKVDNASAEEKKQIMALFDQAMERYLQRSRDQIVAIMPFDELVEHVYYPVYSRYFTLNEITELTSFFSSPLGKKYASVTPALMQESVALINSRYTPELQKKSRELAEEEFAALESELERLSHRKQ